MKGVVPAFLLIASVAAMAKPPQRFLGPPVKKPADPGATTRPTVLKVGDQAPLFGGLLLDPDEAGMKRIDLSSLVGSAAATPVQAVLISFFATWCERCKGELPLLQQLSTGDKDRRLRVISVAIDQDESRWQAIKLLVAQNRLTFPIVRDPDNAIARQYLGPDLQLPAVFLVGKDGTFALVKQGYSDDATGFLRAEVEKALR